ncbi:MAG: hypothetical protein R3277_07860 [Brumimicrobium sp.]|nr:hypothetical protein [Brumimicrobium sp.]
MKKILLLLIILITAASTVHGQMTDQQLEDFVGNASKKELVEKNTLLLMDGMHSQSIIVANKLLEMEPENSNFNYRKGFALFNIETDFRKAIPYLEKAVKNTSKNYDMFSPNETDASVDSYFYLGRCYHLASDITKARQHYQEFKNKVGTQSELIPKADLKLIQLNVAEEFIKYPKNYQMINLGEVINTSAPEYAPVISLDGRALYFTSRRLRSDSSNTDIVEPSTRMYLEDIYVSYREKMGNWEQPQLLDFCLPERNEATVAVSTDERFIYVYKDDAGNGDIFYSEFEDSRFKDLQSLDIPEVNTDAWEPHLTVSPDGRIKFFSSDREGGYGGRDIYRVIKLPNGNWSEPQNLGPTINTPYDEDSPFISVDNKTLYFSHNGEKSMGGFDVFVSVMNEEMVWSDPINLGVPLNSMGDDIYYTTTADGLTGYLSSFRPDGRGEKDIYEIKNDYLGLENVAILTGKIETTTGEPVPDDVAFTLTCLNCGDNSQRIIYPRVGDGGFFATLQPCRSYEMIFHHNNGETEFHRETFETGCELGFEEVVKTILLDLPTMSVIDKDTIDTEEYVYNPMVLKHIFAYNNAKLSTEKGSLRELLDEMIAQAKNGRESFTITVNASASKVPTKTFKNNMSLAEARAENLVAQLKAFIDSNETLKGKVNVQTDKIGVNGPAYQSGTYTNIDKYAPYQYVEVKVNGDNGENIDTKKIESKDAELKK